MAAFVSWRIFRECVLHVGYTPEGCSTRAVFEVKTGSWCYSILPAATRSVGGRDCHTEADDVPAVGGVEGAAVGGAAVAGVVEPGAAAEGAGFPVGRALGIGFWAAGVVVGIGPVGAPLEDVAVYIVQARCIGREL